MTEGNRRTGAVARHHPRWLRLLQVWTVPTIALIVGAALLVLGIDRPSVDTATPTNPHALADVVSGALAAVAHPLTSQPPQPTGPPTRVVIPSINVDAALQRLHLDSTGALQAPTNGVDAGWYAEGPVPGEPGPAVLAGHVDSKDAKAVFYDLSRLEDGAQIRVLRGGVWVRFVVIQVDRYPKNNFPTAKVYGPTPGPQLRLITCGGSFDKAAGSYRDNIVVYAVPI